MPVKAAYFGIVTYRSDRESVPNLSQASGTFRIRARGASKACRSRDSGSRRATSTGWRASGDRSGTRATGCPTAARCARRSEERRVGKSVDLGGRRIIKKKKESKRANIIRKQRRYTRATL